MLSIGLDIGTTGICGLLLDGADGTVLKIEHRENRFFIGTDKPFERIQDAKKIYQTVEEILDSLYLPEVGCIGVTGQMHGIVYLDKEGNLLSPLYTWQDMRANEPYKGSTYADDLGAPAGYGLATNHYNRVNGLIDPKAAVICTIHDYVAMRLAGRKTPLVHSSDAASFGRFDLQAHRFTAEEELLPSVTKNIQVIGQYKNAAVCTAIGDNQASFIGSASGGAALVNVGTGSQVTVPSDGFRQVQGLETRPLDGDTFLLVGCAICGGRAFAMLERFFSSVLDMAGVPHTGLYPCMDRLLEEDFLPSLTFDTRFCGTRENADLRASVTGLSEENFTAKEMTYALVEGISKELYDFYALAGHQNACLVGSGNGLRRNPALCRTVERQFGCHLLIPCHKEEAAFGAALSALTAAGEFDSLEQSQRLIKYL